jgi:NAD(P)-dependent dehydrogenase (short-subunit alcohol dehydrogenase family)
MQPPTSTSTSVYKKTKKKERNSTDISSSSSGLGAVLSETFAKEGCNVAINYFNREAPAQKVASACQAHGVKAVVIKAVC